MAQGISAKEIPRFEMKSECHRMPRVPLVRVHARCPVPITIPIPASPLAAPQLPLLDAASQRGTGQTHACSCAMTPGLWQLLAAAASRVLPAPQTTVLMVDDSSDLRCLLGRDLRYSRCRRASSWFCRT